MSSDRIQPCQFWDHFARALRQLLWETPDWQRAYCTCDRLTALVKRACELTGKHSAFSANGRIAASP